MGVVIRVLENFKYESTEDIIMVGVMGGGGTSMWEPISLVVGFVSLISAFFFLIYKLGFVVLPGEIQDEFFLFYFSILITISGIMHMLSTIGS